MGVKKINGGVEDFTNKFVRARGGDSTGLDAATAALTQYIEATGGIISDYSDGPAVYRAHIFTSSGTFDVTQVGKGAGPTNVEYLVVAGGGSGGGAGGGGAGGFVTNIPGYPASKSPYPVSTTNPYTVSIGSGASRTTSNMQGYSGSDTDFYPTPVSHPSPTFIRATGGGGGGAYNTNRSGVTGGSGGGGGVYPVPGPGGVSTPNTDPDRQGYSGGSGLEPFMGGGGGGAGAVGGTSLGSQSGAGGIGHPLSITGTATYYAGGGGGGSQGPDPTRFSGAGGLGGGGGGGAYNVSNWGLGGAPGGQPGAPDFSGNSSPPFITPGPPYALASGGDGGSNTGGGGGAMAISVKSGGAGGSGIVVVRYQIGSTATAKATGGNISFYGGKTIHTFLGSGTFAVTDGPLSIEYVALGGGAGGGDSQGGGGGGGGAGAFVTGPETANNATSYTVTVGTGGSGALGQSLYSIHGNKGGDTSISGTGISVSALGGGGGLRDSSAYTDTSPPLPAPEAPSMPYTDYASGGGCGGSAAGSRAAGPGGGYAGGSTGGGSSGYAGGGGGGAGGAGVNGVSSPPDAGTGGNGGFGRQIPSTFRNPGSSVGFPGPTGPVPGNNPGGDTSGLYWFGGGGGGGVGNTTATPHTSLVTGKGGGPGAPDDGWAGSGSGGSAHPPYVTYPYVGSSAKTNSGAGGGGGGWPGDAGPPPPGDQYRGGSGGSGIVLIAYPS